MTTATQPTYQQARQLLTDMRKRGWQRTGRGVYSYTPKTGKPIEVDLYAADTVRNVPVWKTWATWGMTPPPF